MSQLVLGPLLRHVDESSAAVWVQTSEPCQVRVVLTDSHDTFTAETFSVHGHHYALVEVTGLAPGTSRPYVVRIADKQVWPPPSAAPAYPPSRIRTVDPDAPLRLVFGSCRTSVPHDFGHEREYGPDVLRAYAGQLADSDDALWPTALLLLGDQVYADEPPVAMRQFIAERRGDDAAPAAEVVTFAEYAELYRLAWSEPTVRWLLSTVPTAMIFDDHDLRDDWNTSHTWREEMARQPWWRQRVASGIGSYWVYQHLGNMSPAERAADPVYRALREAARDGRDGGEVLDAFALRADEDPTTYRWSYHRDFGATRLVMLDSRCARVLTPGQRAMLDDTEWRWFDGVATGDRDHLLIATSLPYLLPAGIHHVESANELLCDGRWGRWVARVAERFRQAFDLEHWAAFGRSFTAVARTVTEVVTGRRGRAPASVTFLSGDVHYSYLAKARVSGAQGAVYQVVCSPIRNPLRFMLRLANIVASFGLAALVGAMLARIVGVRRPPLRWRMRRGPWFGNVIARLDVTGRAAVVRWFEVYGQPGAQHLALRTAERLTE